MNHNILIIFFVIFIFANTRFFVCNSSLEKGVCSREIKFDNTQTKRIFHLNPCGKDEFCDINFGEEDNFCFQNSTQIRLLPGESCKDDFECLSEICDKEKTNTCLATVNDMDFCSNYYDCPQTSFCVPNPMDTDYSKCYKLLDENNTVYECNVNPSGFKCKTNLICNRGKCVKPGSIKIGSISSSPEACETFYMYKLPKDENYICTKGPILVDAKNNPIKTDKPFPCQENELCNYTIEYKGKTIKLPPKICTFPLSNSTNGYCHPGLGNMKLEISKLFNYLKIYNGSCHAGNPVFCNFYTQTDPNFFDAFVAQTRLREYLNVYGNSECVKKVINPQYFYALNRSTFSISEHYLINIFQSIVLIIFILF